MLSTPDSSDSVIHADPSGEPRHYCPGKVPGTKATDAKENSPPLAIISEHEVALGTAAAAKKLPAPRWNRWIATLARLATPSAEWRPRQQCPGLPRADYLAGARIAREMRRM